MLRVGVQLAGARWEDGGLVGSLGDAFKAQAIFLLQVGIFLGHGNVFGQELHEMGGAVEGRDLRVVLHAMAMPRGKGSSLTPAQEESKGLSTGRGREKLPTLDSFGPRRGAPHILPLQLPPETITGFQGYAPRHPSH